MNLSCVVCRKTFAILIDNIIDTDDPFILKAANSCNRYWFNILNFKMNRQKIVFSVFHPTTCISLPSKSKIQYPFKCHKKLRCINEFHLPTSVLYVIDFCVMLSEKLSPIFLINSRKFYTYVKLSHNDTWNASHRFVTQRKFH